MDVLNKIVNQNFDITLSDQNLSDIIDYFFVINDYKQKCYYIRTIIESMNNKIIDPDTFLAIAISRVEDFNDLILIAVPLRFGANPNLYLVMEGVGVIHLMVYTVMYLRDKINNDVINYILCIQSLMGSSYSSLYSNSNTSGRDYNRVLLQGSRSDSKMTVGQWLISQGYYDFSDTKSYISDLNISDQIQIGALVDNVNIAFPMGFKSEIVTDIYDENGILISEFRESDLPAPDLTCVLLFNSYECMKKIPVIMSHHSGEINELKLCIETGSLEMFKELINRGFKMSYFSVNRLLVKIKETILSKDNNINIGNNGNIVSKTVINKIFNILFLDMLKFCITKGVRMDKEQFNMLNTFSENYALEISEIYSTPLWIKSCSGSEKIALPEIVRSLAYSMNIDTRKSKPEVCNAIKESLQQSPDVLKQAAITRQKNRVSSDVHTSLDYANGKNDVSCRNASSIKGNPFEYADSALSYYTDESKNMWCFTANEYENLISNGTNPHTGGRLPTYLINRMKETLDTYKTLYISPRRIVPVSEAVHLITKNDTINNLNTDFINETILRLVQTRGIYEEIFRTIQIGKIQRVLEYIDMSQDYLDKFTQSHRFATMCKALYIYFKKYPERVNDVLNQL